MLQATGSGGGKLGLKAALRMHQAELHTQACGRGSWMVLAGQVPRSLPSGPQQPTQNLYLRPRQAPPSTQIDPQPCLWYHQFFCIVLKQRLQIFPTPNRQGVGGAGIWHERVQSLRQIWIYLIFNPKKNPSLRKSSCLQHLSIDSYCPVWLVPPTLDLLSLICCVFSGKLLNLSESCFPQKTDFIFHSHSFWNSDWQWGGPEDVLGVQKLQMELVLKNSGCSTFHTLPSRVTICFHLGKF